MLFLRLTTVEIDILFAAVKGRTLVGARPGSTAMAQIGGDGASARLSNGCVHCGSRQPTPPTDFSLQFKADM